MFLQNFIKLSATVVGGPVNGEKEKTNLATVPKTNLATVPKTILPSLPRAAMTLRMRTE